MTVFQWGFVSQWGSLMLVGFLCRSDAAGAVFYGVGFLGSTGFPTVRTFFSAGFSRSGSFGSALVNPRRFFSDFLETWFFDFFSAVLSLTFDVEMRSTTCGLRSARLGRRYACCDDASSNGVFARDFSHATMPTRRFHASALPPRVPPWRHYEDRRRTT